MAISSRQGRHPDFFIVGAPKCGTTSLALYLSEHPRIFFSDPKEPHFFDDDFAWHQKSLRSMEEYLGLFARARPEHRALGEGSVWYLYSRKAIPAIQELWPSSRFIAMVREPTALVASLHSQLLWTLDEDEPSLERAWQLQGDRARGRHLPETVQEPAFLQYGRVASLGAQLQRALRFIDREQLHVVFAEDLARSPAPVFAEVLHFLGVPDLGRTSFPRMNENKAIRSTRLMRWLQRPPRGVPALARGLKRVTGVERLGILRRLTRWNSRTVRREQMSGALYRELASYFREDVGLLSELTGRDLSHWLDVDPTRSPARD